MLNAYILNHLKGENMTALEFIEIKNREAREKLQLEEIEKARILAEMEAMDYSTIVELNADEAKAFDYLNKEDEVLGDDEEDYH